MPYMYGPAMLVIVALVDIIVELMTEVNEMCRRVRLFGAYIKNTRCVELAALTTN